MIFSAQSIQTDDFDEFLAWEHALGFESEETQLSRGRNLIRAGITTLGQWTLLRYSATQSMLCEYAIPPDTIEFCISRYAAPMLWYGQEFRGTSIVIHRDRVRYRATLPPGGITYGCSLPAESAIQLGLISERHLSRIHWAEHAFAVADDSRAAGLLALLSGLLESTDSSYRLHQPIHAHDALVSAWQEVIDGCFAPSITDVMQVPKQVLIDNAADLMASRLDQPLTAGEIAAELNVSRRALERGFRRSIGVTPYQYLLLRRLHSARRMIKQGDGSILAVCSRCGFEHPSRFAEMYARQFGELPSQTKRIGD